MRKDFEISLFSGTNLDETFLNFLNQQFKISVYKIFRRDRNKHGGVLCFTSMKIFFVKQLMVFPYDCEVTLIEISIESHKWLCICLHKPHSQKKKFFLQNLPLALTKLSCEYKNNYINWRFQHCCWEQNSGSFYEYIWFGMFN